MFRTLTFSVLVSSALLSAQTWVEERTYVAPQGAIVRVDGLLTHPIKGDLGGFVWFQSQQAYSQAYGGLIYSPRPWVQLALGCGTEESKHPARIGSYVWLGKGKVSGLAAFEDGGSGFWYKLETNYQASRTIGVGFLSERFKGSGPKVEWKIPHTSLKLWLAPLFDRQTFRPVIGVRWAL